MLGGAGVGVEDGPRQRLQVLVLPVHHGHRRPRHEGRLRVWLDVGRLGLAVPEVEVVLAGLQQRLQPRHHRGEGGPVVGGEVPALQHQVVPAACIEFCNLDINVMFCDIQRICLDTQYSCKNVP